MLAGGRLYTRDPSLVFNARTGGLVSGFGNGPAPASPAAWATSATATGSPPGTP